MSLSELPKGKLIGSVVFLVIAIGFAIWMLMPSGKPPEVTKAEQVDQQLTKQAEEAGLTTTTESIPPPSGPVSRGAKQLK